jgi:glycosyltransferase involved in cell wall biosynthesis
LSIPSLGRLIVVTSQRPFPTFHGANADAGRLILALRSAGWTIMLVSWRDALSDDFGLKLINSVVERYIEEPMVAKRPAREWRTPAFAQSRTLADERRAEIVAEARRFVPDLVFSVGLYGASLGVHIAESLGVPHVYRSQAIEHEYYADLIALARQRTPGSVVGKAWRWVRDVWRRRAISRIEEAVLGSSEVVLEISAEDAEIRRSRCGLRIEHLPPCAPEAEEPLTGDRWIDVLYLGNLFMENNRIGLAWFLDEVLPYLRVVRPQMRVVVAGKSVGERFDDLIAQAGVFFLPNVADAHKLLRSAKIAVNPIFTGNGTNLKTIDALWCGCGVVTTAVGVQGYAFEGGLNLRVAHSPVEFTCAILDLFNRWPGYAPQTQRDRLLGYSIAAQGRRISQIFSTLSPARSVNV